MPEDMPIAHRHDGSPIFDNTATVVSVLVTNKENRVLAIRRANNPGKGLLCLPGGYHMRGESWQEAGLREVEEETGIHLPLQDLNILSLVTDEYGNNLLLCAYPLQTSEEGFPQDGEALEILWLSLEDMNASEWAFPRHFNAAVNFLQG